MSTNVLANSASSVNRPLTTFSQQGMVNEFFNVFSIFWKYIIAIFALVWFLYRASKRNSKQGRNKMMGG